MGIYLNNCYDHFHTNPLQRRGRVSLLETETQNNVESGNDVDIDSEQCLGRVNEKGSRNTHCL